jgi:mRNA-degrading endonuclease YafQ of YafQ-DinJ toxin-antitoxin module
MRKYAELEEELELSNLESMEKIVEQLLQKEDLLAHTADHKLITNYLEYKINKLKEKN